ncbi:MAG: hypothetical protein KGI98_14880 [Euryarchaeota archaeon]|nr:hypothetical protein [Euryarchaeota archaeon]MDE1879452.1 hypothetical protein [Euryarchaeota archaeon]
MTTRTLVIGSDGTIRSVYDDSISAGVLTAVGPLHVRRASMVEFEEARQVWVARTLDGEVLAEGPRRDEVVAAEVRILEGRL